jgi:small-conductance mechanosensitive channel
MPAEAYPLLDQPFLGNTLQDYGSAFLVFLFVLAGSLLLRWGLTTHLRRLAARTETDLDDFLVSLLGRIRPLEFGLLALYISARSLAIAPGPHKVLRIALVLAVGWRGAALLQALLSYGADKACRKAGLTDATAASAAKNVRFILNGLVWAGALLFVLDNLGVNITAAVAGLGIGGVAVAMAAQHTLGDLFSSFVIFIDRPFKVGDFINVGEFMGTVERIGIKTTRIRSLSGEMLVFANSDLTGSRLRNYELMRERRVVLNFSAAQDTSPEKTRGVARMALEAVQAAGNARFDRAHLKSFGPNGLEFELVYFVLSGDYGLYMDVQERVNLGILERLASAGIRLAHPTQAVVLRQQ